MLPAWIEMATSRREVLSLYRRILRLGQTWTAKDPASTSVERQYIQKEGKTQFRNNKNVSSAEVPELIKVAEARIEIALHYRNPYPRPVNVPPKTLALKQGRQQIFDSRTEKLR